MKKRLFIFAMLICIALVGCGITENISETTEETKTVKKTEKETKTLKVTEKETETVEKRGQKLQKIKASIMVKYSEKEIIVFSNTTCFFNLKISIRDGEFTSQNTYGEFKISEGETMTLTLENLAHDFFSNEAIIEDVSCSDSYVYGDSPLAVNRYKDIDCKLLIKCSNKEVIVYSDTTCFFDLYLYTEDDNYKSRNAYCKLAITEGETLTLTLDDLAPGFFSDHTIITSYSPLSIRKYIEK